MPQYKNPFETIESNKFNLPDFQKKLFSELKFKAVRSPGPGGQNVNKVASKIILIFSIPNSNALTEEQKKVLQKKLNSQISKNGDLIISANEFRSQYQNKRLAIQKFFRLLKKAFSKTKERKPTKPSKAAQQRRLNNKQHRSKTKKSRQKPIDID